MKDWKDEYQAKLCSAANAANLVKSGDSIFTAGFSAMPLDFSEALAERKDSLEGVAYYGCLSPYPLKIMDGSFKGHVNYITIFTGPVERLKAPEGNIDQLSVHPFGPCGGMGIHTAKELAETVIVTVQPSQPKVPGDFNTIHVSEVDAIIETDVPIPNLPGSEPAELENQIASHVAPLVEDGSTIQVGIGGLPGAVALSLADKKDLGIHTEMLTDAMYHLVKTGAVTGSRKNRYPGKIVYGFAAGSNELLEYLDDNPRCIIRPVSETVDAHLCGQNDNFVSINTCLMTSITGQIASEAINYTQISGTGGQLDLVRAARNSRGGKSFIVLASTRTLKSGERLSNISLGLPPGSPVTTPRTDVEYVATEYGVVNLRYKSNLERARALISIAHPDFRDELRAGLTQATHYSLDDL
jgi:4-hydroxybutyrate CoA-transferase